MHVAATVSDRDLEEMTRNRKRCADAARYYDNPPHDALNDCSRHLSAEEVVEDPHDLPGLKFMRTLWVCNVRWTLPVRRHKPGATPLGLEEAHRDLQFPRRIR
jgi:hypothetical protein